MALEEISTQAQFLKPFLGPFARKEANFSLKGNRRILLKVMKNYLSALTRD